jgi:hypothetical protein
MGREEMKVTADTNVLVRAVVHDDQPNMQPKS